MIDVLFVGKIPDKQNEEEKHHILGLFQTDAIPRVGDTLEFPGFMGWAAPTTATVSKVVWLMNHVNATTVVPRVFFEADDECLENISGYDTWVDENDEEALSELNKRMEDIADGQTQ